MYGPEAVITARDVEEKLVERDEETGKVKVLYMHTWLETENGNVFDVYHPRWVREDLPEKKPYSTKMALIYNKTKGELQNNYGLVYRKIEHPEVVAYIEEYLMPLFGPAEEAFKKV